ncbi:MAG: hypothetical protein ABEJ26_08730 [Halosimplex sp.]
MKPSDEPLGYERTNAVLAWVVVAVLLAAAVERTLAGEYVWASAALAAAAVAVVPSVRSGDWTQTVAWEVLALAAAPVVASIVTTFDDVAATVVVAGVALLVTTELDAYTDVEMTADFAVGFVVLVTMSLVGVWVIAQYVSDTYLGTSLISGQAALMRDVIAATGIGVLAGVLFEFYFRRLSPGHALGRETWGGE